MHLRERLDYRLGGVVLAQTLLIPFLLYSLSFSETQPDVSELQDQRTFCQSLISSAAMLWNLGYRKSVRRYGQYCRPDQEFSDHVLLVVLTKALNTLINADTCMFNSHEEYLNSGSLARRHLFLLLNDQTWKKMCKEIAVEIACIVASSWNIRISYMFTQ